MKWLKFIPLLLPLAAFPAKAAVVSLTNMSTLPSSQGWTYFVPDTGAHAGQAESSVWSTDGTTLSMNTIGSGLASPSTNIYRMDGLVNAIDPIVIDFRSRVLQSEGGTYGWSTDVADGSTHVIVGFTTSAITLGTSSPISFNTTGFHDYRIQYTPGSGTFSFFVDNSPFGTGNTFASVSNRIVFGDGTGAANASAQIQSYTFTQVPEPSAAALALLGSVMALTRRRRWRA